MLLIHMFHFQPLQPSSDVYSPPVISPDFSLLLPLASELCPPSIHPLSPFTCRLLFCSSLSLHPSHIPMVHLGCGCQLRPGGYYYHGGSFRLQFSMTKIRAARKKNNNINAKNVYSLRWNISIVWKIILFKTDLFLRM